MESERVNEFLEVEPFILNKALDPNKVTYTAAIQEPRTAHGQEAIDHVLAPALSNDNRIVSIYTVFPEHVLVEKESYDGINVENNNNEQ